MQRTFFHGLNQVVPMIDDTLKGFNTTVLCYGQTGTGKTYTMEVSVHAMFDLLNVCFFVSVSSRAPVGSRWL